MGLIQTDLARARVVAHTVSNVFSELRTLTDIVSYIARVSNPDNQLNVLTGGGLIKYMTRKKHWSPFEMCNIVLEVGTTRDIARQLLRHRSFSFQEFSQRYADPSQMGVVFREARLQDEKNRQNSIKTNDDDLKAEWEHRQAHVIHVAQSAYQWARDNNIAKEVARSVFPEGMTPSRVYVNGTLRSWIHYVDLRTHEDTQLEHRQLAHACVSAIQPFFPVITQFAHGES